MTKYNLTNYEDSLTGFQLNNWTGTLTGTRTIDNDGTLKLDGHGNHYYLIQLYDITNIEIELGQGGISYRGTSTERFELVKTTAQGTRFAKVENGTTTYLQTVDDFTDSNNTSNTLQIIRDGNDVTFKYKSLTTGNIVSYTHSFDKINRGLLYIWTNANQVTRIHEITILQERED